MNRFKKIHVCIALTLLCAILLGSVCLVHNLTNNRDNIEYDMDILYHEGAKNDIYVRLSRSGEYEMYYGAVFFKGEYDLEIPLRFYDVRKRKISDRVCDDIFCLIDNLNDDETGSVVDRIEDRALYTGYIILRIGEKQYECYLDEIDDTENNKLLLECYNMIMNNTPKFLWKEHYLKTYDANGKIINRRESQE